MHPRRINDTELLALKEQGRTGKELAAHFNVSESAICQRLKKLTLCAAIPESYKRLNGKQQSFVRAKASGKTNTDSALEAYDVTSRASAKALGGEMMGNSAISTAVDDMKKTFTQILDEEGLTQRRSAQIMAKIAEGSNYSDSLKSLDMRHKITGDYAVQKVAYSSVDTHDLVKHIGSLTKRAEEELERLLKEVEERREKGE